MKRPPRWDRNPGFTLVEILIAAGVMLLGSLLFFALFLGGRKILSFGTEGLQFRQASFALQTMSSDLESNGKKLYFPDQEDLFRDYGVTHVVFGNSSGQIVGYVYDSGHQELLRVLYDPRFNPDDPSSLQLANSPGNRKVLTSNLDYAYFQADSSLLLTLLVLPHGASRPLTTSISVPWFQVARSP